MATMTNVALAGILLTLCAAPGCATNPFSGFDDPRPEGRLSLRERSHCEVPDQPDSHWCDLPHEVRAFVERREACDHFRGEPWPEDDGESARARRAELTEKMRETCTGTDATLAGFRKKYREDAAVSAALAGFEDGIEP